MGSVYGDLDSEGVTHDLVTDAVFDELRLFLSEWLSFEPGEYDAADLYAAAAVMGKRLNVQATRSLVTRWLFSERGPLGGVGETSHNEGRKRRERAGACAPLQEES